MPSLRGFLPALLSALLAGLATLAGAETPAPPRAPSDREAGELEQRVEALNRQIENLEAAKNDAVRQTLMEQHWLAMQDYMGSIHRHFGAGAPWMIDADAKGDPGASGCPMLGGSGAAWPLPEGIAPKQYGEQMRGHMQALSEQVRGIAGSADPAQRQRLLQAHWHSMYRVMQGMRGLGWMWGAGMMSGRPGPGAGSAQLPDPDSAGAKLVSAYCTQCHPAPAATLKTAEEWERAIHRMQVRIGGRVARIETPSDEDLKAIVSYLKAHAR